jgi:hypothetical protein
VRSIEGTVCHRDGAWRRRFAVGSRSDERPLLPSHFRYSWVTLQCWPGVFECANPVGRGRSTGTGAEGDGRKAGEGAGGDGRAGRSPDTVGLASFRPGVLKDRCGAGFPRSTVARAALSFADRRSPVRPALCYQERSSARTYRPSPSAASRSPSARQSRCFRTRGQTACFPSCSSGHSRPAKHSIPTVSALLSPELRLSTSRLVVVDPGHCGCIHRLLDLLRNAFIAWGIRCARLSQRRATARPMPPEAVEEISTAAASCRPHCWDRSVLRSASDAGGSQRRVSVKDGAVH